MKLTVVLQRENDGGYVATVPILPGCVSQGDSRQEALKNIEEAIEVYLEDVKAVGDPVSVEDGREYVEVGTADE
jgi:predicted RNase H-like HicB family nuclease